MTNPFCDLLLLRGDDEALWTGVGEEGAGRGASGPRAAASVAVALGKLLGRSQGRIVGAMRGCKDRCAAKQHEEGALVALCAAETVLVAGAWITPFGRLGRGGQRASGGGQRGQGSQGEEGKVIGGEGGGGGGAGGGAEGGEEGRDAQGGAGPSGSVRACVDTGGEQQQQQQGRERRAGVGGEDPCGDARSSASACGSGGFTLDAKEQEQLEVRRRVRVCAYAAWRWLPGLAGLARRGAAEGLVPRGGDTVTVLVWQPLLLWVKQLCCLQLHAEGLLAGQDRATGEPGGEQGPGGDCGSSSKCSSGNAGRGAGCGDMGAVMHTVAVGQGRMGPDVGAGGKAAAGEEGLVPFACGRGKGCGSCGDGGGCNGWCGCWRGFLLQDVGVVELLGRALWQVVPSLMKHRRGDGGGGWQDLLWNIADAFVLLAAAFPEEVARGVVEGAGGFGGCAGGDDHVGGGSSSSSSSTHGSSCGSGGRRGGVGGTALGLAMLSEFLGGYEDQEAVQRALRAMGEWGGECVRQGRAVGPSEQQRAALVAAAEQLWCDMEPEEQLDVLLLPPLCELRALLPGVCSNPRCAVLPPPGQTEAEAAVEAGVAEATEGEAGARAQLEAWYCCRECREEHGREEQRQESGGEVAQQQR